MCFREEGVWRSRRLKTEERLARFQVRIYTSTKFSIADLKSILEYELQVGREYQYV